MESAEDFIKGNFKGIEKETWYPAMAALADGYGKKVKTHTELKAQQYGNYVSNYVLSTGKTNYLNFKDWKKKYQK